MSTAEQIRVWSNGIWQTQPADIQIEELSIDSRKIINPEHALFIALHTPVRDGAQYIKDAYDQGVRLFLIQEEVNAGAFPGAGFILVKDTLRGLQQMITQYRKQFSIPVIGVTGSNGKTIVKEWLYQLLSEDQDVVRSPKSYNSQIGVPLSVWLMQPEHQIAVFEAGISQPGEMEKLEKMIQPTVGIFTNVGEAHSEGFMNRRQKINEKLVLFRHAAHLIYCSDSPDLNEHIVQYKNQIRNNDSSESLRLFTWSCKYDADLRIVQITAANGSTAIQGLYRGDEMSICIPFTDSASVENAIHCWCTLLLLEVPQEKIAARMPLLQPVAMRLELRHGINDCTIINDTYNSDLTSLYIALDFLNQQKQHQQRTVILSDMLQVGKSHTELYEEVAAAVQRNNIQRFIGIGPALTKHKAIFRANKKLRSIFFKSTEEFLKKVHLLTFDKETILLKGARSFAFEKIGMLLEQEVHQTVLSINTSALNHNLGVYRGLIGKNVKVMAMVKAFSYGSGSYEIANALQYAGVDYLAVAYTDEGVALRKAGITMPVMVMSPDATSFDRMIAWKLEPEIFNLRSLQAFTNIAQALEVSHYPVHIKLDTGMHRLGFVAGEIDTLIQELQHNTHVKVASVFSHLAASEDSSLDSFTGIQAAAFRQMSEALIKVLPEKPIRHICNSAGIVRHPELHFDMIRLGLGLYGIDGSGKLADKLIQVSTLKTTIAQIKEIQAGETVGYNRRGVAERNTRIATISIGYGDGYPRALSNGVGHVLIHGLPAKIMGVVCMDMCMVDVTDIPGVAEGDEVILFGPQLPIAQLAAWAGTIPYEIMTGISQRVKRIYVNEG